MQVMCQVFIACVGWSFVVKNVNDILAWPFMVCGHQYECDAIFFQFSFLLQLPERVDKDIYSLVPELISSACNYVNAVAGNLVTKNSFRNALQLCPCQASCLVEP